MCVEQPLYASQSAPTELTLKIEIHNKALAPFLSSSQFFVYSEKKEKSKIIFTITLPLVTANSFFTKIGSFLSPRIETGLIVAWQIQVYLTVTASVLATT